MTPTTREKLTTDILAILAKDSFWTIDATGEKFQATTETDLMAALRERGWKLPAAGWFNSEVRELGFKVQQAYLLPGGKVRRVFSDGHTSRALGPYNTIVTI